MCKFIYKKLLIIFFTNYLYISKLSVSLHRQSRQIKKRKMMIVTNQTPVKLISVNDITVAPRGNDRGIVINIRETKARFFITVKWDCSGSTCTYPYGKNSIFLS